jgi:hypothetical protein
VLTERGARTSPINLINASTSLVCGAAIQKPRTGHKLSLWTVVFSTTCECDIILDNRNRIEKICFIWNLILIQWA